MAKVFDTIILTLITFVLTQSTVNGDGSSELLVDRETIMNTCNESFPTQMDFVTALDEVGSYPDETDRVAKCFSHCVFDAAGVISKDGIFDTARTAEAFVWQRHGTIVTDIEDMAVICAERPEKCLCEKSYQYLKCLMRLEIEKYGL